MEEQKYKELIEKYRELQQHVAKLEEELKTLKEKIATLLHEDKINEIIVELSNGENWFCGYQSRMQTTVDHKLLLEYLGPKRYSEVVNEKTTTFLTIRKSQKKRSDKLTQKPLDDDIKIPSGIIMT